MRAKKISISQRFVVLQSTSSSQVASMTLRMNETEGSADNNHRGSDQWMYVVSGEGVAIVNGRRRVLKKGAVLLIRKGVTHQIKNIKRAAFVTLNHYIPPAYTSDGDELPSGKPSVKPRARRPPVTKR